MLSWTVIAVLIIAAVLALKMNHLRHKLWIIALIFVALFLYTTASVVYAENELNINSVEGVFSAVKIYISWLGNGFQNLKSLSGQAVKMNWSKTNESILTKDLEIK
tara:strand:+ start:620 stop:937 length:318 start_codon:yes stop_codon:yes gene_type:complete